jgi:pimeloyl-ACP methyl ester carboxylesterase
LEITAGPKEIWVRRGYLDSGLGQLHFVEAGSGPALLLIPQAGRSARMYEDLIGELAPDFRVISVDLPGTGSSDPFPDGRVAMSVLGKCLAEGIDALGVERCHVFGLHGGNKVGAALVADHPQRVEKFVYAGQSHSIIPDKAKRDEIFMATPVIEAVVSAGSDPDPMPRWANQLRKVNDEWLADSVSRNLTQADLRRQVVSSVVDGLLAFEDQPAFYRAAFAYEMEKDLARLAVPTLVLEIVTPREDREVGRQGEELLALIPNATLHTLEHRDVYAVTLEDRAAEVAGILRGFFDA